MICCLKKMKKKSQTSLSMHFTVLLRFKGLAGGSLFVLSFPVPPSAPILTLTGSLVWQPRDSSLANSQ